MTFNLDNLTEELPQIWDIFRWLSLV